MLIFMRAREYSGWAILAVSCVIPLVLWAQTVPLQEAFASKGTGLWSLGQIAGILGLVLFSGSLVLSVRTSWLETLFGGLNQVYIAHHIIGGIAFLLLMLHPLAFVANYVLTSVQSATFFFVPGQDWAVNLGMASLYTMMALLIITYYLEFPYPVWRYTHKFLGLAFAAGVVHSLFVESQVTAYAPLYTYLIVVTGVGMICFLYRTVLGKWLVYRFRYVIHEVRRPSPDMTELILTPKTKRVMRFVPGQFVFVSLSGVGMNREPHPFSMSSPPVTGGMRLSVKALGDYTNKLAMSAVGTEVLVEGPYGRFSYLFHPNRSYIWIGGGIGITPILSMAYTVPITCRVDIYYCISDAPEGIYTRELEHVAAAHPHMRLFVWYSKDRGWLTGQQVAETSGDLREKDIFICGPPAMMHTLKHQLTGLGVPRHRILTEEFGML